MKPIMTWILVADGSRARLYANSGPGTGLEAITDQELKGLNLPSREIMADRPGRSFDSAGSGRHAMEPRSDARDIEKERFTRSLAELLDRERGEGKYERLVIVAPPRELGRLRAALPPAVQKCVTAELNKDLVQLGNKELTEHLAAVMRV